MTQLARIPPKEQIISIEMVSPGNKGLNTVQAGALIGQEYAVTALNAVIDSSGRLGARNGVATQSGTAPITFTAPPVGTSATLLANWTFATGVYPVTFSDGEVRPVTLTNGANTATWGTALTGTPNITASSYFAASTTVAFTVPPTGASGNLTIAWPNATGNYQIIFSDGEVRTVVLTSGSILASWTTALTGTPTINAYIGLPILAFFEYNAGNQVYTKVIAWNGGVSTNINNPLAGVIGGTASQTNGRWNFDNFNGKMVGFTPGQVPCVYSTGTGVLSRIVAATGSWSNSSGVGCAAFGRIWSVRQSDGQTIEYSGLLDETDRGSPSSGLIDMHTIWANGTDTVTAIFAFNSALVVCGLKHIVMFTDGRGSMLGLDPTQAYVYDIITGTGCLSQFTVDFIGESDVVYLSPNGLQSLSRLTQERSNPTGTLSKFVRDTLLSNYTSETPNNVSGCYDPIGGFYLLGFPQTKTAWCFDMRRRYMDDTGNLCSPVTTWSMEIDSLGEAHATGITNLTSLYISRTPGTVALYVGNSDEGSQYQYQYLSPWTSFEQQDGPTVGQRLKLLKHLTTILFSGGNANVTVTWNTDFGQTATSAAFTLAASGASGQYGIGQFGISQFGGGITLSTTSYDARASGQYYQVGVNTTVSSPFSLQQIQLTAKLGRVA